jgi:hypothetical protein
MGENKEGRQNTVETFRFLWPRLVELWIFITIFIFFIIRVLGSNFAQGFFRGIKKIHSP